MTTLVRPEPSRDRDLDRLRARMAELESLLRERTADVANVRAALEAFRISYRQHVGLLHEQLDELELQIAEAELGELSRRVRGDASRAAAATATAGAESAPRFTSDAVRKLFRDVAKAIHPDLSRDDVARDRRHALMIEANRAYALGDEAQLRWILDAWERSPEAVQGSDPDAMRLRLERRIAQIGEQLATLEQELQALQATSLWQLKAMVDEAAAKGKDLVRDMVRRLERDILVARNRLEAIVGAPASDVTRARQNQGRP